MKESNPINAKHGEQSAKKHSDPRAPHSIRFSESEWSAIQTEAKVRGMTAAELVRHSSVRFAKGELTTNAAAFPPELAAQIERIYRGVYLLSTLKRDELIRIGKQDNLNRIAEAASKSQEEIRNEVSTLSVPAT